MTTTTALELTPHERLSLSLVLQRDLDHARRCLGTEGVLGPLAPENWRRAAEVTLRILTKVNPEAAASYKNVHGDPHAWRP